MTANDADLHLDGNAAAGWLAAIFGIEMTAADVSCAGCGRLGPIGTLIQYGHDMGVVLRCPGRETAIVRLTRIRDRYWLDSRGATCLRVPAGPA